MNIVEAMLKSWKKFLVWAVSSVLLMMREHLGFTPEEVQALLVLSGSFLVGQGIADFGKGRALLEEKPKKH